MSKSKAFLELIELPISILLTRFGLRYAITIQDRETKKVDSFFEPNSTNWFRWLARRTTKSFVVYEMGVYDEEEMGVAHKDDNGDWSLHTIRRKTPCSVHIGRTKNLTIEKLINAIDELYSLPVSVPED